MVTENLLTLGILALIFIIIYLIYKKSKKYVIAALVLTAVALVLTGAMDPLELIA